MNQYFQDLFYRANAADYPDKWDVFYPLKDELLKKYGSPDGWDLQIVTKECWACDGTGDESWGDDYNECQSCMGTGIYSTRSVQLDRYKLGDRVYHIPQPPPCPGEGYKNKIEGSIKHDETIAPEQGEMACRLLLSWHKHILPAPKLLDLDGVCRAAVLGTGNRPVSTHEVVGAAKGELVKAIARFIDTITAANEAPIEGDETGHRSIRAAEQLADEPESFVDARIREILKTTEFCDENQVTIRLQRLL